MSRNPAEQLVLLPYFLILLFLIFSPWVAFGLLLIRVRRLFNRLRNPGEKENHKTTPDALAKELRSIQRRVLLIFLPIILISTIIYSQEFFQTVHSRKAALFIDRSIEIVSPYISDSRRLELRAEFRAIENAKEFYRLQDKLRQIAEEHAIKLPAFESIR